MLCSGLNFEAKIQPLLSAQDLEHKSHQVYLNALYLYVRHPWPVDIISVFKVVQNKVLNSTPSPLSSLKPAKICSILS